MAGRIYISVVIGNACSHCRICSPDHCFVDTSFQLCTAVLNLEKLINVKMCKGLQPGKNSKLAPKLNYKNVFVFIHWASRQSTLNKALNQS